MRKWIKFKLRQWWLKARACMRIIRSDTYVQCSIRDGMRYVTWRMGSSGNDLGELLRLLSGAFDRLEAEADADKAVKDLTNA